MTKKHHPAPENMDPSSRTKKYASKKSPYRGAFLLLARRIKASLRRTNASSGPASLGLPSGGHHLTWFAAAYSYEPLAARYCNCAASLSETGRAHQLYASSSPHPWAGLRAFDARHAVAAAVQPARRTGHFSRRTGRRTTGDGTEAGSKSEHLVRRSSTSGAVEGIKAKRGLQPRTVRLPGTRRRARPRPQTARNANLI